MTYGFRYRVKNVYGWSEFSPITYILAADPPSRPPKPTFVSATDNSIAIKLYPSANFNGAFVIKYVLEIDQGSFDTNFV